MTTVLKRSKWKIWSDVIFSLFVREIRIGFNDKFGIGWAVLSPLLFIFLLSFIRGRLDGGETHGMPTFIFMAYGMLFVQIFLQTFASASGAIKKNAALFAFRQVQPLSAVIAAGLFELLVKIFVLIGLVTVIYFIGIAFEVADPLRIIINVFSLWLFSLSAGLIFGVFIMYVPEVQKLQALLTRPLFFISGVFFSLQDIPKEFWPYLNWNPILHAIELSRYGAYPGYGDAGVSTSYFLFVMLATLSFSLAVYFTKWKQGLT